MHVISRDAAAEIDFATKKTRLMRISDSISSIQINNLNPTARAHLKDHLFTDYLPLEDLPTVESNPLLEEQRNFAAAIRREAKVRVTGEHGRRALDIAERVLAEVAAHRWDGMTAGATGPRFETRQAILRGPHWQQAARQRKAG